MAGGKGGKPSKFSQKHKDEIFKEYLQVFQQNGKVPSKSDEIWSTIKTAYNLPDAVTIASIYTAMLKKFNCLREETAAKSVKEKKESLCPSAENVGAEKSTESIEAGLNESTESPIKRYEKKFSIDIEPSVWRRIQPVDAIYHREAESARRNIDRSYKILPPGVWTYVLSKMIADKRKDIPCRWVFKRAKVYENGDDYVVVNAKCVTCKAKMNGVIKKQPETPTKRITIMITVSKIDEKLHQENKFQKNVKIGGEQGRVLSEHQGPATLVRRNLLRESIEMFGTTPARVPTANAIRCTRYNTRKQRQIDDCPVKALELLELSCYKNIIRAVSLIPFFCTYVNVNQIVLYKVYKKKSKFTKISCDATGSIAHKIVKENSEKSQKILLYTFVISDCEFQVPIFSMVSEAHHMGHIVGWFFEFIRFFDDTPDIFVSDMSAVLLNCAAVAFARCIDVYEYCELLFILVKNPNDPYTRKLKHQIRIDVNHLVKHITTCDALKMKSAEQKQFFTRATCLLIPATDLGQARSILQSIMIVAKSKTTGTFFNTNKEYLDGLISGSEGNESEVFNQCSSHAELNSYITDVGKKHSMPTFQEWFNEIDHSSNEIAEANNEDSEKNELENPDFVKFLTKLTRTIVLWSALATPYFETPNRASSANVESYFKHVKSTLDSIIPCRVDNFVCAHIEMIDGMIKEASQEYIHFIDLLGGLQNIIVDTELDDEIDYFEFNSIANDQPINDVEQPTDGGVDESMEERHEISPTCIACKDGNFPSGAHKCVNCAKAVHVIDGCSLSISAQEGYGEVRICLTCATDQRATADHTHKNTSSKQLSQTEKWDRQNKRRPNSYLNSIPSWGLDKKIKGDPKIAMLSNASSSSTTFKLDKSGKSFAPRNTCASDAICQLFAAAYAFYPDYRGYVDELTKDVPMFEIAVMLAKNGNMRTINKKRAEMLYKYMKPNVNPVYVEPEKRTEFDEFDEDERAIFDCYDMDCKFSVNGLASKFLHSHTFSVQENWVCKNCDYSGNAVVPIITANEAMKMDFSNFVAAIETNLPEYKCDLCDGYKEVEREFGKHVYIEIPHEEQIILSNVTQIITLNGRHYSLSGAILYEPAVIKDMLPHYSTAIKKFTAWELYDDMKKSPKSISCSTSVIVSSLLYIMT